MSRMAQAEAHDDPESRTPDEDKIKVLMAGFQPEPSAGFYDRMAQAPWMTPGTLAVKGSKPWWRRHPVFTFSAALALLAVFLTTLATPGIRVTAQRFARYFLHSDSDRTAVEVTPIGPGQLDHAFALTIKDAAAQAGFKVLEPTALPPAIYFNGATYRPDLQAVILDYRTEASNQIVRITQQRVGDVESYANIGVSANVEIVRIGNSSGEYVLGSWRLPELGPKLESVAPGVKITLEANWDPDAKVQILRWRTSEMLFEIISIGGTPPSPTDLVKSDLIAIAESIK